MTRRDAAISLLAWALIPVIGTGCGGEAQGGGSGAQVDTLRGVVALEIGELEGDDEYLFGQVGGLAMDSVGRILVAERQSSEIRAFGPDGRFLFRVTGKGGGPGEVNGPCCLAFDAAGRLWVRDGGNGRYEAYRIGADGASYERMLRMQHGDPNLWARLTFDTAGRLVDVGHVPSGPSGRSQLARFHIALDGTVEGPQLIAEPSPDSVDMKVVQRKTATLYIYQPFGSHGITAQGPGGSLATAVTGYYAIRWILPDGSTKVVARDVVGPALSDAEVKWAQDNLEGTAKWIGTSVARLPFGMPDHKAPLQALWFDQTGRLWVQLTRAAADSESLADVYDTTGTLVTVAQWPKGVDLRFGFVTDTVALGVTRDSLGVQRVAVLRWTR